MESFSSPSEYLSVLEARAALPDGFRTATAGIRFFPRERKVADPLSMSLSLILLDQETPSFAAVFTKNRFPGAPVIIGRERLRAPAARGVLINNKISNVCAAGGRKDAERLLAGLAANVGSPVESLFIASTGIIGWQLPVQEMEEALPALVKGLNRGSALPLARAIMTTDSFPKVRRAAVAGGSILGLAKGAGMIEPNMATLLCFLCTDIEVDRERLREDLAWCVERSLNRVSVDGDQSTSDTTLLFSSGKRGKADPREFRTALMEVLSGLAADIVRNAEGASHVIRVRVLGAPDEETGKGICKAIVNSPLVKTAIFGNDPNVGRIVCSLGDFTGNAGIPIDTDRTVILLGGVVIFEKGVFRLDGAKEEALCSYLKTAGFDPRVKGYPQNDRIVDIEIRLDGPAAPVEVLGTDLSHEYVRENADYRS